MKWAVLLMAYGGPDSLDDVEPYLLDVRGGRETPKELVEEIRQRYAQIGGRSPLLEITRSQAAALEQVLNQPGSQEQYKVFVGMRHWSPYIREVVEDIFTEGYDHLIALSMTPFASKMSTGAYREKLETAIGTKAVDLRLVECWNDHKGFIQAAADRVRAALAQFPEEDRERVPVIFTAHSLPAALAAQGDPYDAQYRRTVSLVAKMLGLSDTRCKVGYQSAGARNTRWLGPSLEEMMHEVAESGEKNALIAPVGFVVDHVEVLYDIDIEAQELAEQLGIRIERTESQNASHDFILALADIVREAAC